MKRLLSAAAAAIVIGAPAAMPLPAAAADTVWTIKSCQSNGWGCYNVGSYSKYSDCYDALKRYQKSNPNRQAGCMRKY